MIHGALFVFLYPDTNTRTMRYSKGRQFFALRPQRTNLIVCAAALMHSGVPYMPR